MHRRTRLRLIAALIALALVVSACGRSGSADLSSGLKGDPVTIGMICSCSGAFAASLGSTPKVAEIWQKSVNDAGGLDGHPVKVVVADDAGDATKSQQLVRQLVERDKVIALIDLSASFDATWAEYVTGKNVPVLAGVSFTEPMATNPNFFPTGGTLAAITYGLVQHMQKAGKKKLAVLACAEAPLCAGYTGQITRIAKAVGADVTVAYGTKISASQASYTAQCLAAKESGADSLYVGHGGAIVMRVVDQCKQQGWAPPQFQVGGDVVGDWVKDPNMYGTPVAQFTLPRHDETTPGGKAFHDALTKYAPELTSASNFAQESMSAWIGFRLFHEAAKAGGIGPDSTGADVKKGLYALQATTLDGLTGPLTYKEGKANPIDCYFTESIEDGKWTMPEGTKPICMAPDVAAKVNAAFAG